MNRQNSSSSGRAAAASTLAARQRGFTLLEIMVVVVIIGIMATFVLPKVLSRPYDAQRAKALTDMKSLRTALELYQLDNFDLPTVDQGLEALVTPDENSNTYLDRETVPADPWGNEYGYEPPGAGNNKPRVFTYGADGVPGGEGKDRDFDNAAIKNGEI